MVFVELLLTCFITSLIVSGGFSLCLHDTFKGFCMRFIITYPITLLAVIGFHVYVGDMTLERVERGSNKPSIVEKAEIVK